MTLIAVMLFAVTNVSAQNRRPRPSPPDTVKATTSKGVDIAIAYSQPSIKGRTIGTDIARYGEEWRTGANEQTAITVSKDVTIGGNKLPAGKYSIWSIPGEKQWIFIFNKNTTNWGTEHDKTADVFQVTTKTEKAKTFAEVMKFEVDKKGKVAFVWGNVKAGFVVK
ncbi:DUF2911 domain-containing protein [Mucilaginibacter myungsuensis]